jgi:hypothetical protein
VTLTAFSLRRDMINDLGCCDTGGMAGCAIAGIYTQVVKADTRKGGEVVGVMARRAIQACRQMVQGLSKGDVTVMAGRAVVGYAGVVKRCICKVNGVMAIGTILVEQGWYVIRQFTDTGHIVVAGVARTHKRRSGMIKGARAKRPRGMAGTAILVGRHMGIERGAKRHAARCARSISNMTGKTAITHDTSMIKDCVSKTLGVMTPPAIFGSILMRYCRCRRCGVNTRVSVMARLTRLYRCVEQAVIENTTGHVETHDTMA